MKNYKNPEFLALYDLQKLKITTPDSGLREAIERLQIMVNDNAVATVQKALGYVVAGKRQNCLSLDTRRQIHDLCKTMMDCVDIRDVDAGDGASAGGSKKQTRKT